MKSGIGKMMVARSQKNHLVTMILPMLFSLLKNMMASRWRQDHKKIILPP